MTAYNADLDKFAGYNTQVVGVSVDSIPSHIAWQKRDIGWLKYPLCSDFYPHGDVAKKFGILREGPPIPGINERSIYIVGKDGKILHAKQYPLDRAPEIEEVFEALEKLTSAAAM